jgi:PAS domain S-box-containing protein
MFSIQTFKSWFGTVENEKNVSNKEIVKTTPTSKPEAFDAEYELIGQLAALHNAALVSETDLMGIITFANDTFCAISKYTRSELIGQNHRILKSGKQSDEIFVDLWQTISSGRFWKGEICNRAKDGTYYWVAATITPVLGADGKPVKYVGVRFDITRERELKEELQLHIEELKATEEELRTINEELHETNRHLASLQLELQCRMDAVNNANIVSETDLLGNITFVNDTFCRISGYSREELIGQNHRILKSGHQPDSIFEELWQTISAGKFWQGTVKNKTKHGGYYWVKATVTPILGTDGKPVKYISIRTDITAQVEMEDRMAAMLEEQKRLNAELTAAKELLENAVDETRNELKDSIVYAQRIQHALLPTPEKFAERLPAGFECFVIFMSKDSVGGDFYWIGNWKNKTVVAVGDGTGHGVPGAFMSIVGIGALTKIVEDRGIIEPGSVLEMMDEEVRRGLNQTGIPGDIQDSLEVTVCALQPGKGAVALGSAMRQILHYRRGELTEIPGDRRPVGGTLHGECEFSTKQINMSPGDVLYLFSDGYFSQIGGNEMPARTMGRKRFKEIISSLASLDLPAQRDALLAHFADWKGDVRKQTDDVVVVGIRYKG